RGGLPLLFAAAAVLAGSARGGSPAPQGRERIPRNDPRTDPYTKGTPEAQRAAGIVSLGGFEFALTDTAGIDAFLAAADIRWIETAHFEIGMGLGAYKVPEKEAKAIRAELEALAAVLPGVDPTAKLIDPWLRAHLYAQRAERAYARFVEIFGLGDTQFPDAQHPWMIDTPYLGEGPHLGQKGKFEVLLLPSEAWHSDFLHEQFGLQREQSQRWNIIERDSLLVAIHTKQGDLRSDVACHCHLVFNLAHLMLDGYKHYSYDTPFWLLEGLGHFMEREIDPTHNTFDAAEGSLAVESRKSNWDAEAAKLVRSGEAPSIAELVQLKSYADFEMRHHVVAWSMTKYLIEERRAGYTAVTAALHGRKNAEGFPDGSDLPGVLRAAVREHLGQTYAELEAAWTEWARKR
ncbi:MAG: hypothetical protein AB1726_06340, partial [Planctomycetota bacterium]